MLLNTTFGHCTCSQLRSVSVVTRIQQSLYLPRNSDGNQFSSQIFEGVRDLYVISENYFPKLLEFCRRHCSYQECTFLGREVTVENKFFYSGV